jgi:hypothetical protein
VRAFVVELLRFLGAVWSRSWRWTLRKKRNFFLSFGVLGVIVVIASGVLQSGPEAPEAAPTPTPTPTSSLTYTEIQATPFGGSGVATPEPTTAEGASIPDPTEPAVDLDNPESVAQAFLTAYLSRPNAEWDTWTEWVSGYAMPEIIEQLRAQMFFHPGLLEGKPPTAVAALRIGEPEADAETNTPIRWSHTVAVDVLSADGSTTTVSYGLVLADSDAGWIVTSVAEVTAAG